MTGKHDGVIELDPLPLVLSDEEVETNSDSVSAVLADVIGTPVPIFSVYKSRIDCSFL